MTYSHRNGETEPPTDEGWFWCYGSVRIPNEPINVTGMLYVGTWHDGSWLANVGNKQLVAIGVSAGVHPQGEWYCRWWGPVTPPWVEVEEVTLSQA